MKRTFAKTVPFGGFASNFLSILFVFSDLLLIYITNTSERIIHCHKLTNSLPSLEKESAYDVLSRSVIFLKLDTIVKEHYSEAIAMRQ